MALTAKAGIRSRKDVPDKRAAILHAAIELFAQHGLHSVSTSAIAKKAGIAKGTLFTYFETKEQLLNELYIEVSTQFSKAILNSYAPHAEKNERFRSFWFAFAGWYLGHGNAVTFMLQCEVSSVLTSITQSQKEQMDTDLTKLFFPEVLDQIEATSFRYVGYSLILGPILVLAQMRDKGEVKITDELLEETFIRVKKAFAPSFD